jgi:hypothetical protein
MIPGAWIFYSKRTGHNLSIQKYFLRVKGRLDPFIKCCTILKARCLRITIPSPEVLANDHAKKGGFITY